MIPLSFEVSSKIWFLPLIPWKSKSAVGSELNVSNKLSAASDNNVSFGSSNDSGPPRLQLAPDVSSVRVSPPTLSITRADTLFGGSKPFVKEL